MMVCLLTILLATPTNTLSTNNTTEVVSTESTDDSSFPSLAVDPDGSVHIAWHDLTWYGGAGTDTDIFYKFKIRGWSGWTYWTVTEVVSTESTDASSFPSLAVDPDGNVHVAWEDYTDYGGSGTDLDVFYKAKIAGSWTTTEVVSTESTDDSLSPSLAIDIDGNVHVAWWDLTDYSGAGTDVDVFYKARVAGTWTTTEVVSTESTAYSYSPSLALDPDGNVYIAWADRTDYGGSGDDADIFYKAKIGGSWTTTEVVSTESTDFSEDPSLAVDLDGNVYVAWEDETDYGGSGAGWDIFYKAKIAGSWTTTEVVSTESTAYSLSPSLAVDADGNVYVAWSDSTDYGGAGTDTDIFFKAKIGGSWTTTEVVSTESTSLSYEPSLALDPDGNVHVAWIDFTNYGGAGYDEDVFYKMIVSPFTLSDLMVRINTLEAKLDDETRFTDDVELAALETALTTIIDAIEVKLDDETRFTDDAELAALKTALTTIIDAIEAKLDDETRFTDDAELGAAQSAVLAAVDAAGDDVVSAIDSAKVAITSAISASESSINSAITSTRTALEGAISSTEGSLAAAISSAQSAIGSAVDSAKAEVLSAVGSAQSAIISEVNMELSDIQAAIGSIQAGVDEILARLPPGWEESTSKLLPIGLFIGLACLAFVTTKKKSKRD